MSHQYVDHTYHDLSCYIQLGGELIKRKKADNNFPAKLHMMLSDPNNSHIITWMPHGRAWKILNQEAVPTFFAQTKFHSFTRQLSGWGFKRLHRHGADYGCYYHQAFLRGLPRLTILMTRVPPGKGKCTPYPEGEPDFYMISSSRPVPPKAISSARDSSSSPVIQNFETEATSASIQHLLSNAAMHWNGSQNETVNQTTQTRAEFPGAALPTPHLPANQISDKAQLPMSSLAPPTESASSSAGAAAVPPLAQDSSTGVFGPSVTAMGDLTSFQPFRETPINTMANHQRFLPSQDPLYLSESTTLAADTHGLSLSTSTSKVGASKTPMNNQLHSLSKILSDNVMLPPVQDNSAPALSTPSSVPEAAAAASGNVSTGRQPSYLMSNDSNHSSSLNLCHSLSNPSIPLQPFYQMSNETSNTHNYMSWPSFQDTSAPASSSSSSVSKPAAQVYLTGRNSNHSNSLNPSESLHISPHLQVALPSIQDVSSPDLSAFLPVSKPVVSVSNGATMGGQIPYEETRMQNDYIHSSSLDQTHSLGNPSLLPVNFRSVDKTLDEMDNMQHNMNMLLSSVQDAPGSTSSTSGFKAETSVSVDAHLAQNDSIHSSSSNPCRSLSNSSFLQVDLPPLYQLPNAMNDVHHVALQSARDTSAAVSSTSASNTATSVSGDIPALGQSLHETEYGSTRNGSS